MQKKRMWVAMNKGRSWQSGEDNKAKLQQVGRDKKELVSNINGSLVYMTIQPWG